jgi:hypothetical protein
MPRLFSQSPEDESRRGRFYIVPETSFWFGTYTTLDLSPQVGYHVTDRWSVGTGMHYIYYRNIDYFSSYKWSTHMVGIKAFTRLDLLRNAQEYLPFYLFNDLFLHAEYEALSLERRYFDAPLFPDEGRFWMDNFFVGFGIMQRMGEFNGYSIMLLWNLNNTFYSPYSNPSYRVGLTLYL